MKRIISAICVIALVLSLCACGTPSPSEVTGRFLDAFKAQDVEGLKAVYEDSDSIEDLTDIMDETDITDDTMPKTAAYFQESVLPKVFEFDYVIKEEKIDGDKATVSVDITTYAFGDAFTAAMTDMLSTLFALAFSNPSDDQVDVAMRDAYKEHFDGAEKDCSMTMEISLSKTDDGWVVDSIEDQEEIIDPLLGGMLKAIENTAESFEE